MDIIVKDNLTLADVANNPGAFPAEVKAVSLEVVKKIKQQLREMEIAISGNVIEEMKTDNASKILFLSVDGSEKTLTLKSAPKKLNPAIKNYEDYLITNGFPNLLETKIVPISWSNAKEIRKQGSKVQEVIDYLYVEGQQSIEIK